MINHDTENFLGGYSKVNHKKPIWTIFMHGDLSDERKA